MLNNAITKPLNGFSFSGASECYIRQSCQTLSRSLCGVLLESCSRSVGAQVVYVWEACILDKKHTRLRQFVWTCVRNRCLVILGAVKGCNVVEFEVSVGLIGENYLFSAIFSNHCRTWMKLMESWTFIHGFVFLIPWITPLHSFIYCFSLFVNKVHKFMKYIQHSIVMLIYRLLNHYIRTFPPFLASSKSNLCW